MPKKFASGSGMRSNSLAQASPIGMPIGLRLDDGLELAATGSGDSLAMMRRQSLSGRPALTPRTMTSTASGKL